jgi:predicted HicB family RNase H-like nuclease
MNNLMEYKGYFAKIEYSNEDNRFFGTILGIADAVSFEGEDVKGLKTAFVEAVDDYLELCARTGRAPEKMFKGSFNIRVSPEVHRRLALRASSLGISLNRFVEQTLEERVTGRSAT